MRKQLLFILNSPAFFTTFSPLILFSNFKIPFKITISPDITVPTKLSYNSHSIFNGIFPRWSLNSKLFKLKF